MTAPIQDDPFAKYMSSSSGGAADPTDPFAKYTSSVQPTIKKEAAPPEKKQNFLQRALTSDFADADQFAKGLTSTGGAILGTMGKAAEAINKKVSGEENESFFTNMSVRLYDIADGIGEAQTVSGKVANFAGSTAAQLPLGMATAGIVNPAVNPIASKMLGGVAGKIAGKIAAGKAMQAGIAAGIEAIPAEVIGGVASQAVVDPSSLDTPEGLGMAAGMSLIGAGVMGVRAGALKSKELATILAEASDPTLPKTIDPSLAPALRARANEAVEDLKALFNLDPVVGGKVNIEFGEKLPTRGDIPKNTKVNIITESGDLASNTKGFAGFGKGPKKNTLTPISPLQLEILEDGRKIQENIRVKTKKIENISRKIEVDGESTDRLNELSRLTEEVAGHVEDYNTKILPYMAQEMSETSTKFGVLKGGDGKKIGMRLGKTAEGENLNSNPATNIQPPNVGPTPFLVRGQPYTPPANATIVPPVTYNTAPPAPGVSPLNRLFGGGRNRPPAPPPPVATNPNAPTPTGLAAALAQTTRERPKFDGGISGWLRTRANWQDYKAPLSIFGDDVADAASPLNTAHRLSGSSDRAYQNLHQQPMLPDGNGNYIPAVVDGRTVVSMEDVLKTSGTDDISLDHLDAYLHAKQVADGTASTGLSNQDAAAAVLDIEQNHLNIATAAKMVFDRTKAQAEYLRRKVGDTIANAWVAYDYAPLNRNLNTAGSKFGFLTARKSGAERVFSPIERHVENTATAIAAADKTELWQRIGAIVSADPEKWAGKVEIMNAEDDPAFLQLVQQIQQNNPDIAATVAQKIGGLMSSLHLDKSNRTITYSDKGVMKKISFHADFDSMFEGFAGSTKSLSKPQKVAQFVESIPRTIFSLANDTIGLAPLRDLVESSINDPNVNSPKSLLKAIVVDPIRAIREIRSHGPAYQQVLAAGGGIGGRYVSPSSTSTQNSMDFLIKKANGSIRNPVEVLQEFSAQVSQIARMGAAMRVFDNGGTADQAATMFRHVIADPQQVGTKIQTLSKLTAFMNMGVQSAAKTGAQFKEHPLATSIKGFTLGSVPAAALWFMNKDDKEIQQLRTSKGGEQFFYIRATPESPVIAMRKPFLYGQIFGTGMESILDELNDTNPRALKQLHEGIIQQLAINVMPLTLQSVSSAVTGYNFMGLGEGAAPLGGSTAGQMAEDVRTNNTSTLARTVASTTGLSAAWIDTAIRTFATTEGARIINYFDRTGTDRTAPASSDLPIVGAFLPNTKRPNLGGLTDFYEKANQHADVLKSLKDAEAKGDPDRIRKIASENLPQLRQALVYADGLKELSEINKAIRIINENKLLSPSERREKIDSLQMAANEFALRINSAFSTNNK